MFSKKKNTTKLDSEQRELYDYARNRTLQKKGLFQHFVIFLIGSVFLILLNVVIGFKEDFLPLGYNWFVWAILLWAFIFFIHFFNVFVTNSFMGKQWEDRQLEKLVKKQKERITKLQLKVEKEHPLPNISPGAGKNRERNEGQKNDPSYPSNDNDFDQPYNT